MFRVLTTDEYNARPWEGGCRVGTLDRAPGAIHEAFGTATINEVSGDNKVDREWIILCEETDETWGIYAYKATSLYYSSGPSPSAFWASKAKSDLSIGGNTPPPPEFYDWVDAKIAEVSS